MVYSILPKKNLNCAMCLGIYFTKNMSYKSNGYCITAH